MRERQERLDALLHGLTKQDGVLGAALVSRDGLAVKTVGMPELARETFSAMTATLLGAAEIALAETHGGAPRSIVCSTDRMRLVLVGATPDLLLVACLDASVAADKLVPLVEAAALTLPQAVSG